MKDVLEEIIAYKILEVARQKQVVSIAEMEKRCFEEASALSMSKSLLASSSGIISEFKRRSPSKGWIKECADASVIPADYGKNGASAISILTDSHFFGGSLDDILTARHSVNVPILRKDFIIDEYQIYQAKSAGANAILLIAAALPLGECKELAAKARELGLEVLLEIHSRDEIKYISDNVDMIGVNNRNLGTFHTDVGNSFRLIEYLPKDRVLVSESGISDAEIVKSLRSVGYRGFLIGENFMTTDSPGESLKQFISRL